MFTAKKLSFSDWHVTLVPTAVAVQAKGPKNTSSGIEFSMGVSFMVESQEAYQELWSKRRCFEVYFRMLEGFQE